MSIIVHEILIPDLIIRLIDFIRKIPFDILRVSGLFCRFYSIFDRKLW